MAKKRTNEFQHEAVRLALSSDLSRKQTAIDLGVGFSTLNRWIQIHRHRDDVSTPSDASLEQELAGLRKENRLLKEERDVLKKATQFFARQK